MTPRLSFVRSRLFLVGVPVVAVGAIGIGLFQPWKLFTSTTVNEAFPAASAQTVVVATTLAGSASPVDPAAATVPTASAAAVGAPEPSSVTTVVSTAAAPTAVGSTPAPITVATSAAPPVASTAVAPITATSAAPPVVAPTTVASTVVAPTKTAPATEAAPAQPVVGTFQGIEHDTSGSARVVQLADGSQVLRLENLSTSNGPDLVVYLSPQPPEGGNYGKNPVNLGKLKGNRGNQNYDIPAGTDLAILRSVVIWCQRFSVGFGVAPLTISPA